MNVIRAVAVGDRLGGHLVQGHVDGTGTILARQPGDRWEVVTISLPGELARYVVPYPFGTTLVLSNGDVGLVVDCTDRVDPARRQRPLVRCSQNIRTGRREGLWEVDLASRTDLTVQSAIYA